MAASLTSLIPGFGGLNSDASNLIKQLMSGQLSTGTRNAIYSAGAERGAAGGMPGATGYAGSLFANNDLHNIGLTSNQQQQQGFQDFLSLLSGLSPVASQGIQQEQFQKTMDFNKEQANRDWLSKSRDYLQRYSTPTTDPPRVTRRQLTPGYVPGGYSQIGGPYN